MKGRNEFPVGALQATFKWISESTVSPRQKVGNLGKVSFSYHTLEIPCFPDIPVPDPDAVQLRIPDGRSNRCGIPSGYGLRQSLMDSGDGTMLGIPE